MIMGWVEWCGGDMPVAEDVVVEVEFFSGSQIVMHARGLDWEHIGEGSDIAFYRVVEQEQ
jgi:hypothetical protein